MATSTADNHEKDESHERTREESSEKNIQKFNWPPNVTALFFCIS